MLESRRQLSSGALRASVWPRRLNCVARATGLGDWRSGLEGSVGLSKEDEVVVEATGNAMAGGRVIIPYVARVIVANPLQVPQQSPAASRAHTSAVVYLVVYPSSAKGPRLNGQNPSSKCLI